MTSINKTAPLPISVGVPHVKSRINDIRNSSYNTYTSILDIMDNVSNGYMTKILFETLNNDITSIIIMDNDKEGFKHILNDGIHNPLNMGHHNPDRHQDDTSNSEYGIGLKSSAAFLGNELIVYTRIGDDNYKAILDFDKMCEEEDPIKSYDPVIYKIDKVEYNANHKFEYGSTIKINRLRIPLAYDIFWGKLKNEIINTYNYQIKLGKVIMYKGDLAYEQIKHNKTLEESPLCKKRMIYTTIYFSDDFTKILHKKQFKKYSSG